MFSLSKIKDWKLPELPEELKELVKNQFVNLSYISNSLKEELAKENREKVNLELLISSWLYDLVRLNIKRGRIFTIERALAERKADCLAYGKILSNLAKNFGLKIGLVEVIVDNAGRYVSHPCNLLKLSDGSWKLVDLWYGSKEINHRRIGARIKEKGEWKIKDFDLEGLTEIEEIDGLPAHRISGLTYYTFGNIYWNRENWSQAIGYYSRAAKMYPENARIYFNLALAYEKVGEYQQAEKEKIKAFKKDPSGLRLLAREYPEIKELIKLDELEISEREQRIYLLAKGFQTGQGESLKFVSEKYEISEKEAEEIILRIEKLMKE